MGLAKVFKHLINWIGLDLVRYYPADSLQSLPPDFDPKTAETVMQVRPFTMTSPERIAALCDAVRYLEQFHIPGAIVECGVWRGGSMMAAVQTLLQIGRCDRHLYLFDTFTGMVAPGEQDVSFDGRAATPIFQTAARQGDASTWCYAALDEVQQNLYGTGYDPQYLHFIPGKVEHTLPAQAPDQIALLRLDTDWYESTRHELIHLFPRIVPGGVIIIDDYGYWKGARKAVDEYLETYFQEHAIRLFLHRIDLTGRIGIIQRVD